MRCFDMFVTAVCVLFLLKLKWPKNKSFASTKLISCRKQYSGVGGVGEVCSVPGVSPTPYVQNPFVDFVSQGYIQGQSCVLTIPSLFLIPHENWIRVSKTILKGLYIIMLRHFIISIN